MLVHVFAHRLKEMFGHDGITSHILQTEDPANQSIFRLQT